MTKTCKAAGKVFGQCPCEGLPVAVHSFWFAGGSPRSARMLQSPLLLHRSRTSRRDASVVLVHVRCIKTSTPTHSSAFSQRARVVSLEEPPAPQVTSTHRGFDEHMRSIRLKRL